jgi:hypothetical protein
MLHNLKQEQHFGVMETRDHSKNGASPKSHTSRGNIKTLAKMTNKVSLIVTTMIVATALTCCQKMEKTTHVDISADDLAMAQKIESFISRMNTASVNSDLNLKSGGLIEIEDARWNLEAAANYTFADIPELFVETKVDTLEFMLAVDNGFCTENSLSAVYQDMNAAVQAYCSTLGEYQLLGVSVVFSDKTTGVLTVCLISARNEEVVSPTFGPTDYWCAGIKAGKCGPYNGQYKWERDAATELQTKANASIPKVAVTVGYTVYYTNFSLEWYGGYTPPTYNPDYIPGVDDPLKEYLFYYESPPYHSRCLSPDLLNFYLTNIKNVGINNKPVGKIIHSYTCEYSWTVPTDWDEGFHQGQVNYAIMHIKSAGYIQH